MKSSLTFLAVFVVVLAAHAAAIAGPGDPRLVNGVLEWPRALTNEPFVVVRGDDGALYYVTITAARRDATLAGGARIAVLGLEGRTPHEITALGVGVGDSVESALANLQGAKPAAAASAPAVVTPPIATAPTPPTIAAPTSPNGAAPTAAAPAPPPNGGAAAIAPGVKAPSASTQVGVVPPTRTPAAATNIPAAPTGAAPTTTAPTPTTTAPTPTTTAPTPTITAPTPTITAPPPTITAPAPTTTAPAPNAAAPVPTAPAPAVTPTTPGFGPYPAVISAPTAPPAVSAAAAPPKQPVPEVAPASAPMPSLARDDRRWTEVTGVVEAINGRTLVLRSTEGRIAVDMSNLSSNLERILTPGATVRVYGLPVEVRFKAMGFVSQ